MIINNFYPTMRTIPSGTGDENYDTKITAELRTLTANNDTFCDAYLLFYVPWEFVPPAYKASHLTVTSDDFTISCITEPQNVGALYCGFYLEISRNSPPTNLFTTNFDFHVEGTSIIAGNQYYEGVGLYNQYSIRKNKAYVDAWGGGFVAFTDGGNNQFGYSASIELVPVGSSLPWPDRWFAFLKGELSFDIRVTGSYGEGSFPPSSTVYHVEITDLEETGYKKFTIDGKNVYIGLASYIINRGRDENLNSGVTNYTCCMPGLVITENGIKHLRASQTGGLHGFGRYDDYRTYDTYSELRWSTLGFTRGQSAGAQNTIIGDINIRMEKAYFDSLPQNALIEMGESKIIGWKYDNDRFRFYRFYTPDEIKKHLNLFSRYGYSGAFNYAWGDSYYIPKYTEDNEQTTEVLNGQYSEISEYLRPWQDEYLTLNEFTEDDIPDYNSKNFPERDLKETNPKIQNFINKFIDGRAGTVNSFESSRMES